MRELWRAACGRIDVDVAGRAWWLARLFGVTVTPEMLDDMHPLRVLEKPPPTPEQVKAAETTAWAILDKGLAHLNTQRKG